MYIRRVFGSELHNVFIMCKINVVVTPLISKSEKLMLRSIYLSSIEEDDESDWDSSDSEDLTNFNVDEYIAESIASLPLVIQEEYFNLVSDEDSYFSSDEESEATEPMMTSEDEL